MHFWNFTVVGYGVGIHELGTTTQRAGVAAFAKCGDATCQLGNDFGLHEVAHGVEIDLRLAEGQAHGRGFLGFVDDLRSMKQGLAGDATPVQAHAAQLGVFVHQQHLHPVVGSVQRRRITTGATTDDEQLGFAYFRHVRSSDPRCCHHSGAGRVQS